MIISHTHRYVFVQTPMTGSTAIGRELRYSYDGQDILDKHSRYYEFWRQASKDERLYFAFSAVRNPLDRIVSQYVKYATNHLGIFTDGEHRDGAGGYVTERHLERFHLVAEGGADFPTYVRRYFTRPYDDYMRVDRRRLDFLMRYENLQADFSEVLRQLNLTEVREIPVVNPTEGKRDFVSYYPEDLQPHAAAIFGPYMKDWGYELPEKWAVSGVPLVSRIQYHVLGSARSVVWRRRIARGGVRAMR